MVMVLVGEEILVCKICLRKQDTIRTCLGIKIFRICFGGIGYR